jgi:hypothetical protein
MLFDSVGIAGTRKTADGYLVANVRVARTGIQIYTGREVDPEGKLGLRDMASVRVYRPEEEVFSHESMHSYAHRPITNDHPTVSVSAENWRDLSVGQTGGEVKRDGDFVVVPMVLMDAPTIRMVESGKRQLSMGYNCVLDATPGVTPDGQDYDAVQRQPRMNHLAVVVAARAGEYARIGDEIDDGNQTKEMREMSTRKVIVDGITIETTDQGAEVISKLQNQLRDASASLEEEKKKAKTQKDEHDAEMAKKDAQIDDYKSKIVTGDALDAAVVARGDLLAKANAIVPGIKTAGLSDSAIRRNVVVAKFGDSMKDKADAYIDARFDILSESAAVSADAQQQLRDGLSRTVPIGDGATMYADAQAKANANLNAHRNK